MIPFRWNDEIPRFTLAMTAVYIVATSVFGCGSSSPESEKEEVVSELDLNVNGFGLTNAQSVQPLIVVGERVLSLGAAAELMGPPPQVRRRPPEVIRRQAFVNKQLQLELLTVQARRDGLFFAVDNQRLRGRLVAQALIDETVKAVSEVAAEEVQGLYEKDPQRFTVPARASVLHLVVEDRSQAIEIARKLGPQPDAVEFGAVARLQSLDTRSKQRSGRLGVLTRPKAVPKGEAADPDAVDVMTAASWMRSVAPEVIATVFESEGEGRLLGPVLSKQGHHLMVVVKRWPEKRILLSDVQKDLAEELKAEAGKKVVDALVQRLRIEYDVQLMGAPETEGG